MTYGIRFRYGRDETLQYIAHLDMLRLFERTLRRSGLPVAHTQGFNPRMKLVFGLPMSTGLTSEAEYADVELDRPIVPAAFVATMNTHLPRGMQVYDAVPVATNDNVMLRVAAARYRITFRTATPVSREDMQGMLVRLLESEHVPVMKKGKKGLHEVDIRPLVYAATIRAHGEDWILETFMSAGAADNLRPDLFMEAWHALVGTEFVLRAMHREALYASIDNEWLALTDPRACGSVAAAGEAGMESLPGTRHMGVDE